MYRYSQMTRMAKDVEGDAGDRCPSAEAEGQHDLTP
jgi:hypothetical protein